MWEKLKNNLIFILISVIVILLLLNLKQCNNNREDKIDAKRFDQAIAAINDSIHKVINAQGDTVFMKRVASMNLNDLVNSETFQNLSNQNKQFFLELQKVKGLLASSQVTIASQAEIIKQLSYSGHVTVSDSTVCFIKGDTTTISDSLGNLRYTTRFQFGDSLTFKFMYHYKANVQSTFIRNKDKSVRVEYKLDDPYASVVSGQAFIIPQESQSKINKFVNKTGKWLIPAVAFTGGVYIGLRVSK